jgi:hypothetical protein
MIRAQSVGGSQLTGECDMPSFLRGAFAGHRVGATIATATIALVVAGGTAAGLAITSGGTVTAAPAAATTTTTIAPTITTTTMVPTTTTGVPSPAPVNTPATQPTPAIAAAAAPAAAAGASVIISDTCFYSHEANDDPILMPGQTGQAMAHDFFGNTTTSASSTAASLRGGPSTCSTSNDASAYWTPVLYQNGVMITPRSNLIYWAGLHATDPTVTVPPSGLEVIAGDESATAPQSTRVIDWRCAEDVPQSVSATPVNCAGTKGIELRITFPSCWDGSSLGGASQTNVAYPVARTGVCPTGYPVRIPTVIFHVIYPITSAAGLALSMGPNMLGSTDTAHGDFINGWNQSVLTELINGCENPALTCGHVTGADANVKSRRA